MIDACLDCRARAIEWIEIDPKKAAKLKEKYSGRKNINGMCYDFLEIKRNKDFPPPQRKVILNPPYTKNQDIKHVLHALENWLAPGGRIVAIMPDKPHPKLDKYNPVEYKLGAGAFKQSGTNVATKIVVIDLPV